MMEGGGRLMIPTLLYRLRRRRRLRLALGRRASLTPPGQIPTTKGLGLPIGTRHYASIRASGRVQRLAILQSLRPEC